MGTADGVHSRREKGSGMTGGNRARGKGVGSEGVGIEHEGGERGRGTRMRREGVGKGSVAGRGCKWEDRGEG